MEVILLKPVRKLGNIGDTVKVALGYGRNYLIPQNIAIRATDSSKEEIEKQRESLVAEAAKVKNIAEINIAKFANKAYKFIRNASHDGKLYGSIAAKEIAKEMSIDGCTVKGEDIVLSTSIKSTGIHEVKLSLYPEVECKIFLAIGSTQAESDMLVNKMTLDTQDTIADSDELVNPQEST